MVNKGFKMVIKTLCLSKHTNKLISSGLETIFSRYKVLDKVCVWHNTHINDGYASGMQCIQKAGMQ